MSYEANQKTIDSYNAHVEEYINGTPQEISGDLGVWLDEVLSYAPKGSTILELGSAFGRDADYFESAGYKVQRTDATKAFVDLLIGQGHDAKILNAITDDFGGKYSMVFANAVLLHFTPEETSNVIRKAYSSLDLDGILAFTVKEGTGESWSEYKLNAPRYFCYWQEDNLRNVVTDAGFDVVSISQGTTEYAEWLHVIAQKANSRAE